MRPSRHRRPQAHQAFQLPATLRNSNGGSRETPTGRLVRTDLFRRQLDPARTGRGLISAPCPHHARRICLRSARSPTLHTDEGRTRLSPGMCAGFKAGTGNGHRLVNETSETVVYLEVGDRSLGDEGIYPDDDLKAVLLDGQWIFQHKDGTHYLISCLCQMVNLPKSPSSFCIYNNHAHHL